MDVSLNYNNSGSDRILEKMKKHVKLSIVATIAPVAAFLVFTPALAQTSPAAALHLAQARMPEPGSDPDLRMSMPGGSSNLGVRGCWRSKQILFGKYSVAFCLERGVDGAYRVDGGGLTCHGDLDWSRDGLRVEIRFNRGRCNHSTDWSRDRISCRVDDGRADVPNTQMLEQAQARMPVPSAGKEAWRMNCIYRPSTGFHAPERFTAKRTD